MWKSSVAVGLLLALSQAPAGKLQKWMAFAFLRHAAVQERMRLEFVSPAWSSTCPSGAVSVLLKSYTRAPAALLIKLWSGKLPMSYGNH